MSARTHTFPTPQPLTLRVHNPAGQVEITAAETTETTVEVIPVVAPPGVKPSAAAGRKTAPKASASNCPRTEPGST
ncbi:MAG: hypothetical protein WKF47_08565 [Geodermatophilaceae bacterium]